MTKARTTHVDLDTTEYYHCYSRCVQQAFLCGVDYATGKDYSHRRGWMAERLAFLGEVFAVDVCAYAMMGNHSHVVVRVDRERARAWAEAEVIERIGRVYPSLPQQLNYIDDERRAELVEKWRKRLHTLSWFMAAFHQWFGTRANREVGKTGRFWEGRFKCKGLLDMEAVLTTMVYVDLNPVRAKIADALEESDFTSIQQRLVEHAEAEQNDRPTPPEVADEMSSATRPRRPSLIPFAAPEQDGQHVAPDGTADVLPLTLNDYVNLVRWTGEAVRHEGAGVLRPAPRSLALLAANAKAWVNAQRDDRIAAGTVLGRPDSLAAHAERQGKRWLGGQRWVRSVFAA